MAISLLRLPAVLERCGKRRTAQYQDIRNGLFTKPIAIGVRQRAWPSDEVDALNEARISGKSDDEVRELVRALEAARGEMRVNEKKNKNAKGSRRHSALPRSE